MSAGLEWKADSSGLMTATLNSWQDGRKKAVVESLPDGGWEWIVWADDASARCLRGQAPSMSLAMTAAERAVGRLASVFAGETEGWMLARSAGVSHVDNKAGSGSA